MTVHTSGDHPGTARMTGNLCGPGSFSVASASMAGERWLVEWITPQTRWCGCPRFHRDQTCRHVEAVAALVLAEARTPAAPERRAEAARRLEQIEQEMSR